MIVEKDIFSGEYHVIDINNNCKIVFKTLFESEAIEYAMRHDK